MDLDGGEMLPGCRWDVNIRTQIEVRFNWDKEETWIWEPGWRGDKSRDLDRVEMGPGLSWDTYPETWIGWYRTRMTLRYYSLVEKWPGWRRDTHLETCMGWDDAWMELRCNLVELDGSEMVPGWMRDANIRTQIEVRFNWDKEETWIWEPGWRGDTHLETWMGLRWDLDWAEMHILRRGWGILGLGWSWDTILQLRKGLDGGETHRETCMGLRLCLDGTKMQFSGPEWRRDISRM